MPQSHSIHFVLAYYVRLLTLFTKTGDLHRMVGHFKVEFFGYLFLFFFNGLIEKFYDITTLRTDEMVMVLFKSQFILFPLYTKRDRTGYL